MIKTYEIDLDDSLVDSASNIFETLGSDIDAAIAIFLKQSILRKGFPFDVTIPEEAEETESGKLKTENEKSEVSDESSRYEEKLVSAETHSETENIDIHEDVSEEEECAVAAANSSTVVESVSPEIVARVAANEALVAQMRNEIGDKAVTPEFEENEDDGTHGDYDSLPTENEVSPAMNEIPSESGNPASEMPVVEQANFPENEVNVAPESENSESADDEDEDENTPDNLFDAWDVGDEEEIGCR